MVILVNIVMEGIFHKELCSKGKKRAREGGEDSKGRWGKVGEEE